jgi:phage shock protein PspC (stress-responsive transcriptional regulator)
MQVRLVKGDAMDPARKLYRSKTNRQVAGVCGGLAEHFNLDATLIRCCSSCWQCSAALV